MTRRFYEVFDVRTGPTLGYALAETPEAACAAFAEDNGITDSFLDAEHHAASPALNDAPEAVRVQRLAWVLDHDWGKYARVTNEGLECINWDGQPVPQTWTELRAWAGY
ncbi:hypothetical protein [Nitrospirillum iridis]|uniref:Uncharacterized protein n=1 Tax=Nitrospirillum iridis TaxID=765888 RepID=A0A7X0AZI2_9PROT|nr:hypothetical protein [Nitrospirillum iridis]MBB6253012.1 hypothetical protein [Nitrospirillum iridis]